MNIICALMAVTGIVVTCLALGITVTWDRYGSELDYSSDGYSSLYWDYQSMRWRFQVRASLTAIIKTSHVCG